MIAAIVPGANPPSRLFTKMRVCSALYLARTNNSRNAAPPPHWVRRECFTVPGLFINAWHLRPRVEHVRHAVLP
jgi:hypothetical protein